MIEKLNRGLLILLSCIILLFVLAPIIVLIVSSFNSSRYFEFPPTGFTLEWYQAFFKSKEYQKALLISARVASTAATLGLLAGIPAAFALDRYKFRGNAFVQSVFSLTFDAASDYLGFGFDSILFISPAWRPKHSGILCGNCFSAYRYHHPLCYSNGSIQFALCRSRSGKSSYEPWRETHTYFL